MNDRELIRFFPYKYLDASREIGIDEAEDGNFALIRAVAVSDVKVSFVRKGLSVARAQILAGDRLCSAVWYNRPYIRRSLFAGKEYLFFGKVFFRKNGVRQIQNPLCEESDNVKNLLKILPVYKKTKDAPKNVRARIAAALKCEPPAEELPAPVREKLGLLSAQEAYNCLHFPPDFQSLERAGKTVAVADIARRIALYRLIKEESAELRRVNRYTAGREAVDAFIGGLPFTLTDDQAAAVNEIIADMDGDTVMNRILEGDVGSGKTIVAFAAAAYCAASGFQAAFMAPTEVLARQHYKNALKYYINTPFDIVLLTGSMKKEERDTAYFNIKHGNARIVIGTHALFTAGLEFSNLALIVTDEQHRFGVAQRNALGEKGASVDTLALSATPIPRTLSLMLYGDLKVSLLRGRPMGAAEIQTNFVSARKAGDMYGFIAEKIAEGGGAYFICPRIEPWEDEDFGEAEENRLTGVKELHGILKKTALNGYGVGLLHGQMNEREKNRVMDDFSAGKIGSLVATTVVEVGIDVRRANVMVIYNAERFGLGQLHQLRGRIGRNGQKSWCFLICGAANEDTVKRLTVLKTTYDGFKLAEYDYDMRGAGDFLGLKQHGKNQAYGNVKVTAGLVGEAKEAAEYMLLDGEICADLKAQIPAFRKEMEDVILN